MLAPCACSQPKRKGGCGASCGTGNSAPGFGARFRRQVPLGPYIVDFLCFERRLVIEADGGQHCDNAHDERRDAWLTAHGFRVLRFWNNDILENTEGVATMIAEALK